MDKIIIFSGTTEGKLLSNMLSKDGIKHMVSVATQYGKDVMTQETDVQIHVGKLTEPEMEQLLEDCGFSGGGIVVDATHPFATEVTSNISEASKKKRCRLIRVKRDDTVELDNSYVNQYDDMADFALSANDLEGNILLTTGTKDLEKYRDNVSSDVLLRTYVRVIPSEDSIRTCMDLGIESAHIIAMHGPFGSGLNREIIRQFDIRHMCTKESGEAGGFREKMEAAAIEGIGFHVIKRPETEDDEGVGLYEAYHLITGRDAVVKRNIVLAGAGPGGKMLQTHEVRCALATSDAVFGAESVIAGIPAKRKYAMYSAPRILEVLDNDPDIRNAVVLFSGDSGFYSGAKEVYSAFEKRKDTFDVRLMPGISSVSCLAAKLGVSWDDAQIVSIHGDSGLHNMNRLVSTIAQNSKTFALLSSPKDVDDIAGHIKRRGLPVRMYVGQNLSLDDECVKCILPGEAGNTDLTGKITALFINESPSRKHLTPYLTDDMFERGRVPMTKECVRDLSIAALSIRSGDKFLDIGGGTGSVAVSVALLDPSVLVTTVEKDPEAFELIKKNIEKFSAYNVMPVFGDAADVIGGLDRPDCVFIGGSGGKLAEIIRLLRKKGEGIRYVVNAVSLETIAEAHSVIKSNGVKDAKCVRVAVEDAVTAGEHHIMKAENAVMIFSFTI